MKTHATSINGGSSGGTVNMTQPLTNRDGTLRALNLNKDAEAFKAELAVGFNKGVRRDSTEDVTINKFCKDWLCTRKPELRPASLESYVNTISRLKDFFGKDCKLRGISAKRSAVFIAEQKSKAIGHEGGELSDSSREQIKRNCKCLFNVAVEWGLLVNNPFKALWLKKLTPKRWHRLVVPEYYALLEAVKTLREKVIYAVLYTSGARLSEAFSLTWADVDFDSGKLIIANREGTTNIPSFHIKDHEARRVPLPKHTIDLLTEYQTQAPEGVPYILLTKERYERVKAKWQQLCKEGKPWRNRYMVNNVLRNFKAHYKRAGIKPVGKLTIHTLRKSCGQNWADYLPMNVVKELMGHSDIATTQKYYNQVDADHEAKAARVIQQLLENKTDVSLTYEPISGRNGD